MGLMRLLLAFAVMAGHSSLLEVPMIPGHLAVKSFFILCGFYMTLVLTEKYQANQTKLFYSNRMLRLLPLYFTVIAISLFCLLVWDIHPFASRVQYKQVFTTHTITALILAFSNLAILGQDLLFCFVIDKTGLFLQWNPLADGMKHGFSFLLIPQAWSMAPEVIFYILAPFLLRLRVPWILFLLVVSMGLRLLLFTFGPEWSFFGEKFFPSLLLYFLTGSLGYRLFGILKEKKWTSWMGLVLLAGNSLLICVLGVTESVRAEMMFSLFFALSLPWIFVLTKKSRLDRVLGDISFPFYLIHFLLLAYFEEYLFDHSALYMVAMILFAAILLYVLIELPLIRLRQRRVVPVLEVPLPLAKPAVDPQPVWIKKKGVPRSPR